MDTPKKLVVLISGRMDTPKKLVVLISGNGSNLQAILDACKKRELNAQIVLVVSNRKDAYGLKRAELAGIATLLFPLRLYKETGKTREEYDSDLARIIKKQVDPDLIILAGWMHILSVEFLKYFERRVINLHPALPNTFDGIKAISRAFEAYKRGEITKTGVMVHFVIPDVDKGEVIAMDDVMITENDTLEELEERMHAQEHKTMVRAIKMVLK